MKEAAASAYRPGYERRQTWNAASIGFKNDNSTQQGEVNVNINYAKINQSNQLWNNWFETESQDPAAQQLVGRLNTAGQSAGWAFAQQQMALSHKAFNLVKEFSDFTGNKNCSTEIYEYCLRNSERPCWPEIGPDGQEIERHCWGPEYSFPRPGWRRDRHCA